MTLESKLIKALKKKNKDSIELVFEEIYNEYYNLVCFIIYRFIKTKEDVEELASDVFLNFFNHLDKIEIINIKYYLVKSAKNLSLNFIRKNKNKETFENYYFDYNEQNSDDNMLVDELEKKLPKDDFYILYEHIVNERSLKAISLDLDKSYEAVKKRYQRIVNELRGKNNHER